tara:strand:+ start:11585 stop:11875 length:291 start_codon:yes stop_codon:yes gene_type:complete
MANSRLGNGFITISHKGKDIPTSVGSKAYERRYNGIKPSSLIGTSFKKVPLGYEHRPDLIANLFYGSSASWWKVCEVNSIFDVFEELDPGDGIYLP